MDYSPELMEVAALAEADYNPRKQVQERMTLLRLSLLKLGFLLPVYATPEGHLLSGHQRLAAALGLGALHMPVCRVQVREKEWRQINLVFNRATNDMNSLESSKSLFAELLASDLGAKIEALPDLDPRTSNKFFRAMHAEQIPIDDLVAMTSCPYSGTAVPLAKTLYRRGVVMPVVAVRGGQIINGNYRAFAANDIAQDGGDLETWPVVWIEPHEADVARAMLNMVSMDFSVEDQHADLLRYGSFRRAPNTSGDLARAFRFWAQDRKFKPAAMRPSEQDAFWGKWRQEHGRVVCDFGAGQRRNAILLAKKGVECASFEPYPVPWDIDAADGSQPSLELAQTLTDTFLAEVASGKKFDSVFLSAVLNSVPFYKDRLKVLACVHGLCDFHTVVYGTTRNVAIKRIGSSGKGAASTMFELDYEKNVVIGEIQKTPKVQKYMDTAELRDLLSRFWCKVEIWNSTYLAFKCSAPRRLDPDVLREALLFEFDLPYPSGRLDRASQAVQAYGKRHAITL